MSTHDDVLERRLEDTATTLRTLRDVDAIKAMHRTYLRCLADRDFAQMASFFTEDAVMDLRTHGPDRGREAIEAHFDRMAQGPDEHATYLTTSPVIHVDGDRASGEWTWHRHASDFAVPGGLVRAWGPWLEGRYRCEYARVGSRWLFSSMWFRVVLPDPDSGADDGPALAVSHDVRTAG